MIRNSSLTKINDRYISSRSAERDRQIDRFKIEDHPEQHDNFSQNLSRSKFHIKTRTPTIINDENALTQKMYLALLKTQIFENKSQNKSAKENSSSKCLSKKKAFRPISSCGIAKNLNETFFNSIDTNKKPERFDSTNNFLSKNPFEDSLLNCASNSLSSFLNLDIDENETSFNLFKQNKIPKAPYKVLDAPNLREDFYLNLLSWSGKDMLAVGLDKILYLWNGASMKVTQISTLDLATPDNEISTMDYYSSIIWTKDDSKLLVGTSAGVLNVFDSATNKLISSFQPYSERIDVIAPMNLSYDVFSCGAQESQENSIKTFDLRQDNKEIISMNGHKQEVCGLKWSPDDRRLASGGNDNKLIIWNAKRSEPEHKFSGHKSAVKAIDWSPFKFGYLISGGGSDDRTIKMWNTTTMSLVDSIYTSSQVCNVAFSRNSNEFVTTHGYSENYILVWDSNKMDVKATLRGHKGRVIYLSIGPDSRRIVTGAGDETIRFWEVFNQDKKYDSASKNKSSQESNQKKNSKNSGKKSNKKDENLVILGDNVNIR